MSSREAVMGKVRRALGVTGGEPARQSAVSARLAAAQPNIIPARGRLEPEARVQLFCTMAEKVSATVTRVARPADVPAAIAEYLRAHNLGPQIRTGFDPALDALPWRTQPNLERSVGASDGSDPVAVSRAFAGVAESGTLVLLSGADNPTTLNFLPDTHIVVVDAKEIAGDYETIWKRLRERYGAGQLPRTVNYVTGPSRSADIEQTLILGAHGPRALHIVVVG